MSSHPEGSQHPPAIEDFDKKPAVPVQRAKIKRKWTIQNERLEIRVRMNSRYIQYRISPCYFMNMTHVGLCQKAECLLHVFSKKRYELPEDIEILKLQKTGHRKNIKKIGNSCREHDQWINYCAYLLQKFFDRLNIVCNSHTVHYLVSLVMSLFATQTSRERSKSFNWRLKISSLTILRCVWF